MQKIQIISPSGNIKKTASNSHSIKVTQPGSIIKIIIDKTEITGSQKANNNLVLVKKNGEKILLEDFFSPDNVAKTKLVIEDGGHLYKAEYDGKNFAGLDFVSVKSIDEVVANPDGPGTAIWLVPLVGAGLIGGIIAIAKHQDNDDSSGSSDSSAKKDLATASRTLEAKLNGLRAAKQQLENAEQALKANPQANTVKAVNDAQKALADASRELEQAKSHLDKAISEANKQKIDTHSAQDSAKQAADALSDATAAQKNAEKLTHSAEKLLSAAGDEALSALKNTLTQAEQTASLARKEPTQGNIDSAQAQQTQSNAALSSLQTLINNLKSAIDQAKAQGINVSAATQLLQTLESQHEKSARQIAEDIQAALKNQQDINTAQSALTHARQAADAAQAAKQNAEEKLRIAQQQKQQALEQHQVAKVQEINDRIKEANKALDDARKAAENANKAIDDAQKAIDRISPDVAPAMKPQPLTPLQPDSLKPIDKGLVVDNQKSFTQSIQDFAKQVSELFNTLFQEIGNSAPAKIFKNIINDMISSFHTLDDVLSAKASALVNSLKTIFTGGADLAKAEAAFFKNLLKIGIDTVKELVSETANSIKNGITTALSGIAESVSKALQGITLSDLLNPARWVELAKNVVTETIGKVITNILNMVKEIPAKIIDVMKEHIGELGGALAEKFTAQFNTIKTALSDVVKALFDGFIKNPLDKLVKPILDKISEFMSNPVESIQKLLSTISDCIKDGMGILKNIASLPGKFFDAAKELIKNIIDSAKPAKVNEGDGHEIQNSPTTKLNSNVNDEVKNLLKALNKDSHKDKNAINLDKHVPPAKGSEQATTSDKAPAIKDTHLSLAHQDDEHSAMIPVAA
ncbi:BapA/Bap/LapF family prefix-like domain-containing protein [Entomohabitans teleogrylli]|uniref:BapA/Bap/LapF family prefix-like domain-containing protein n=1 Tax=Entomohabitans teleogrylli TaxID=1384589 RepID=UPI00073D3DF5|nr:hypothetical protein [Entomohabitans teleogrylli]